MPEDYFWNILLTEQGLELIVSQLYVACGYLLSYLGMAGGGGVRVGCGCGLGFHVTLDSTGRSPPGPTPPLMVMFLLLFKSFSCRLFNLAKLKKWNPICVNKQSDFSQLSPGKDCLLIISFPNIRVPRDMQQGGTGMSLSLSPRGRGLGGRRARCPSKGGMYQIQSGPRTSGFSVSSPTGPSTRDFRHVRRGRAVSTSHILLNSLGTSSYEEGLKRRLECKPPH